RNDGGASLLRHPCRIRAVVEAVRVAVPREIPVSAKLRLGWDSIDAIHENAAMAAEGGADWLTIHARTRVQGYNPPVFWPQIGRVRETLKLPIVANGDIWTLDDFRRCRDETGCIHYMLGRSALANPALSHEIARELGLPYAEPETDWLRLMQRLIARAGSNNRTLARMKQWLNLAHRYGDFRHFDLLKRSESVEELTGILREAMMVPAVSV
ncbi:tRNA-dihydrouridine synthase family protein, partial [bacterium]